MKKKLDPDTILLSKTDIQSYESLIIDLKAERQVPEEGTWNYVVKIMSPDKVYIGSYLFIDGPMIAKSSGAEPSYRKIVYVGGEDWSDEHIFVHMRELFDYLGTKHTTFKRYPFGRTGTSFVASDIDTVDLTQ